MLIRHIEFNQECLSITQPVPSQACGPNKKLRLTGAWPVYDNEDVISDRATMKWVICEGSGDEGFVDRKALTHRTLQGQQARRPIYSTPRSWIIRFHTRNQVVIKWDNMTCSKSREAIEDNIKAAVELATRRFITGIVRETLETHLRCAMMSRRKESRHQSEIWWKSLDWHRRTRSHRNHLVRNVDKLAIFTRFKGALAQQGIDSTAILC